MAREKSSEEPGFSALSAGILLDRVAAAVKSCNLLYCLPIEIAIDRTQLSNKEKKERKGETEFQRIVSKIETNTGRDSQ